VAPWSLLGDLGLDMMVRRLDRLCDRLTIGVYSNSSGVAIVHRMKSVYPELKEKEEFRPSRIKRDQRVTCEVTKLARLTSQMASSKGCLSVSIKFIGTVEP